MSWDVYDKVLIEEQMRNLAMGARLPPFPEPEPLRLTLKMRQAVIAEIQQLTQSMPVQYAWIVKMALLDYGCRSFINEPDEPDEADVEDQSSELYRTINLHQ